MLIKNYSIYVAMLIFMNFGKEWKYLYPCHAAPAKNQDENYIVKQDWLYWDFLENLSDLWIRMYNFH